MNLSLSDAILGPFCHACNSKSCWHITQGMAQQQMSHYNDALRHLGNSSVLVSNGSSNPVVQEAIQPKDIRNKKLLLLRR
jgi:hypothetical protein